MNIKFKSLCKQYLTKHEFDLTINLWKEFIRWHRVNYAGNNNSKFRLHPSFNEPFCNNAFNKEKNIDKKTQKTQPKKKRLKNNDTKIKSNL